MPVMDARELKGPVMVLSAAAGAGHVSAAEALVSAFGERGVTARHLEVLRHTNPVFRKVYADLYLELMNRGPDVLGWIYDALDHPWKFQKRRLALDRINTGPLIRLLKREHPGAVLCTHFLPAEIVVYLRRKGELTAPLGVVVTDFDAHAMWLYRNVDWYFVACEETKAYLAEVGIPPETIHVTGIPVNPVFARPRSKLEARLRLGLAPDLTTILVVAGGFGVGPVEELVKTLRRVGHRVQIAVVCGRNGRLEESLRRLPPEGHPVRVAGYTREMDAWMAAADLYVGKAGGLSSSEALARGLVLVIVNPIPGQEEHNTDHFLEEGAALRCRSLPVLPYKIDALLADEPRFGRMRENARRLARPAAAAAVASVILGDPEPAA